MVVVKMSMSISLASLSLFTLSSKIEYNSFLGLRRFPSGRKERLRSGALVRFWSLETHFRNWSRYARRAMVGLRGGRDLHWNHLIFWGRQVVHANSHYSVCSG